MITHSEIYVKCLLKAEKLVEMGLTVGGMGVEELTNLLVKLELEKKEKDEISDQAIEYNDEIIDIEPVGELDTIDISVSGDNLFYCNGVLTKNSFGLPATADFMFGLISTEELEELGQLMVKQLKNRWGDTNYLKRFVVGIDRSKMRLFDAEEDAQDLMDDTPMMDRGDVGQRLKDERDDFGDVVNFNRKKKPKFDGFK